MNDKRKPPSNDFEVGYGKPPVAPRFKPGVSGNPKGRPKRVKTFRMMVDEAFNKRVKLPDGKVLTKRELGLTHWANGSARGETKAIKQMIEEYRNRPEPPAQDLDHSSPDDEAILRNYFARYAADAAQSTHQVDGVAENREEKKENEDASK